MAAWMIDHGFTSTLWDRTFNVAFPLVLLAIAVPHQAKSSEIQTTTLQQSHFVLLRAEKAKMEASTYDNN
jgi:hypothetical protein